MGLLCGFGKVLFKPLVITKEIDSSTPQLMPALTSKEFFKSVTLELVKANRERMESTY